MRKSPREAYRDLKPKYPNAILAFGIGEMLVFVHSDAHEVHNLLQLSMDRDEGYDRAVAHKALYFQLKERLRNCGKELKLVARNRSTSGKVTFTVEDI